MPLALPELISLGALALSAGALAWQMTGPGRARWLAVEALATRLTIVETKLSMLLDGIGRNAAMALHSPHTPALDALLDVFAQGVATEEECASLGQQLRSLCADPRETGERKRLARDILLVLDTHRHVRALQQQLPRHLPRRALS